MKRLNYLLTLLVIVFGLKNNSVSALSQDEVNSPAEVEFKANTNTIPPVNPEGEEIDSSEPPTEGPLSINYASDLKFGKQQSSSIEKQFYAQEDEITVSQSGLKQQVPNFVQITDLRGTGTGWVLSVRQNGPLRNEQGTAINGAVLKITARLLAPIYGKPALPVSQNNSQLLHDDGKSLHEIVRAEAGTGVGTWNIYLGLEDDLVSGVSLTVPKNEPKEVGNYSTSLTWFLQDTL